MSRPWKPLVRVYDRKAKAMVDVRLSVEIDWNAIAQQLAKQAISNKSRKATQLHGALKASILEPKEITDGTG